ncbi:transporter [Brevibacillus sp. SKDU10]|uniref:DMT family transporter n=1 Tax=Brevibacillus sp. SKDU10 TaxID=1247872 RepID=UPI0007C87ECE|nr:multidrug efflux SMR transporter [Brevibacillus sp. SKDU10]OAJ73972.1 transporter [Brevibacillus sp. SKDU10]
MGWVFLFFAGCFEIVGVLGLKKVSLKQSFASYLILMGGFALSFTFLNLSMQSISMGTAYAIWTGIGTVGSALLGMLVYKEPKEWRRILFIMMIVSAAIGLKIIA